jgi:uncharacterized protein (TIGR03118 family)
MPATQTVTVLKDTALVSDGVVPAAHIDPHLQNAWGLAFGPGGPFWIADNNDSLSTLYDGNGAIQSLVVSLPSGTAGPANPTGQVFNATNDFSVASGTGGATAPALFLFDGEGGTLVGWASGQAGAIAYDDVAVNGVNGAVYKGLALANNGSANYLYATDLHNAKVDVFDATFSKVSLSGGAFAGKFTDPNLPAGYAPFGIAVVNGQLFVTYAQQNAAANDEILGAGLGVVDVFDLNGNFLRRFATGGVLNAPWGIALAPAGFGTVGGQLLIGNFGDGRINGFDLSSGASLGPLTLDGNQALVIPGLWALLFGNGALNAPANALFYTAGPNNQTDGVFGRIDSTTMSSSSGSGGY